MRSTLRNLSAMMLGLHAVAAFAAPASSPLPTASPEAVGMSAARLDAMTDYFRAAADAHLAGLEALAASGGDVSRVHSVASVFVSRIDGVIDKAIDERLKAGAGDDAEAYEPSPPAGTTTPAVYRPTPAPPAPDISALEARVAALETEVAELRALLESLTA